MTKLTIDWGEVAGKFFWYIHHQKSQSQRRRRLRQSTIQKKWKCDRDEKKWNGLRLTLKQHVWWMQSFSFSFSFSYLLWTSFSSSRYHNQHENQSVIPSASQWGQPAIGRRITREVKEVHTATTKRISCLHSFSTVQFLN